jgi:hypothetical protein
MPQPNYFERQAIDDVLSVMFPKRHDEDAAGMDTDSTIVQAILSHSLFPKYLSARRYEFGKYANSVTIGDEIILNVEKEHPEFSPQHFQAALLISERLPRE